MARFCNVSVPVLFAALAAAAPFVLSAPAHAQWSEAAEQCYASEADPAGAVLLCTQAIESGELGQESLAITYANRGNSFYDLGRYSRAIADYDVALDLLPGDPVTLSNRGAAYLELGENELAFADLNEAIELYPDNPVALTNRCWIHAVEGRFELARFDCDEALGLEPNDPIALASRAYVLMQLGDISAAQADADQAVRFGDHLWQTHFYRGLAYEASGDLSFAEESYRRAGELAPEEPRIQQKLAEIGADGE
jgi:Flp pilus assembly protein TadD